MERQGVQKFNVERVRRGTERVKKSLRGLGQRDCEKEKDRNQQRREKGRGRECLLVTSGVIVFLTSPLRPMGPISKFEDRDPGRSRVLSV